MEKVLKQRFGQAKTTFIEKNNVGLEKKINKAIEKKFIRTFV